MSYISQLSSRVGEGGGDGQSLSISLHYLAQGEGAGREVAFPPLVRDTSFKEHSVRDKNTLDKEIPNRILETHRPITLGGEYI
jgi:hypothetical protein